MATIFACAASPASSISAKPAVNMTMALTPRLPSSSTAGAASFGGDGDDRDVRRLRQVGDRGIGLQALHLGAVRIDRIKRARESLRAHIGDRPAADPRRIGRSAEHGDGAGRQKRRKAGETRRCRQGEDMMMGVSRFQTCGLCSAGWSGAI